MKIELYKRVIITPSPYMEGNTTIVPDPVHGTITAIIRDPLHRIIGVTITDGKGKKHHAYPHQILSRMPKVYNFI